MKTELQQKFYDEFPGWFNNLQFGFELDGDGWFDLLWSLCTKLKELGFGVDAEGNGQVSQVKSKFGSLRFYTYGATDEQWELIGDAELASETICEYCDNPSEIRNIDGWLYNMCELCYQTYLDHRRKSLEESKKV